MILWSEVANLIGLWGLVASPVLIPLGLVVFARVVRKHWRNSDQS